MIGGAGKGHVESQDGDGLFIGGFTSFDNNLTALIAMLNEWSRADESYAERVANLQNSPVGLTAPNGSYTAGFYLNSSTVHDDAAGNHLQGGSVWIGSLPSQSSSFSCLGRLLMGWIQRLTRPRWMALKHETRLLTKARSRLQTIPNS